MMAPSSNNSALQCRLPLAAFNASMYFTLINYYVGVLLIIDADALEKREIELAIRECSPFLVFSWLSQEVSRSIYHTNK